MADDTSHMVMAAAIAAIPPTLASVAALVVAFRGSAKLTALHLQINSRMDQLLAASTSAARAEGVEAERADNKERVTT